MNRPSRIDLRLIDSHAHLDDRAFHDDRAAVIAASFARGIGVLTVGVDLASSRVAVKLASRHRNIWAVVGVHPHDAKDVDRSALLELENLAQRSHVVGIGEIGLDYYRDLSPRSAQRRAFGEQLALARRMHLPVVIHNRESTVDLLGILREVGSSHHGVIHSFLGDISLAETFLDLGFHLGVGGPLTYNKNDILRNAVRRIPLDRILVETDCPYLTPVPYRGKRNEPAYIELVAQAIAELKGVSVEEVARRTAENTDQVFALTRPTP
ncbi:TatD family hydrolase [Candidatus Bipolaricaulota bacterium]|nr:TatD family hydrolase [Candidatus Bipolaricaulota bacterium]